MDVSHISKKKFLKNQEDWKKAVWQYLMDHSQRMNNGKHLINFISSDIDTFWERVHARKRGAFSRVDLEKEKEKAMQAKIWQMKDTAISFRLTKLQRFGPPHIKLLFWFKKWTSRYLIRKSNKYRK